jgi:hypothetical protein
VRRRSLLRAGVAGLAAGLAGCGGDGGDGGGAPRVFNVEAVPPVTENREFATTLDIEYAYSGQSVLAPDEAPERSAPDEVQFFVCQFRVENVGEAATPVSPAMFQLAAPSADLVFERVSIDDPDYFPERSLDPGDVANGWVVFQVPQTQDKILLALDQEMFPEPVDATFAETDLAFTLDDDDTGTDAPDDGG